MKVVVEDNIKTDTRVQIVFQVVTRVTTELHASFAGQVGCGLPLPMAVIPFARQTNIGIRAHHCVLLANQLVDLA